MVPSHRNARRSARAPELPADGVGFGVIREFVVTRVGPHYTITAPRVGWSILMGGVLYARRFDGPMLWRPTWPLTVTPDLLAYLHRAMVRRVRRRGVVVVREDAGTTPVPAARSDL